MKHLRLLVVVLCLCSACAESEAEGVFQQPRVGSIEKDLHGVMGRGDVVAAPTMTLAEQAELASLRFMITVGSDGSIESPVELPLDVRSQLALEPGRNYVVLGTSLHDVAVVPVTDDLGGGVSQTDAMRIMEGP